MYKRISGFSDEISSDIIEQFEVLKKLGIGYFEPRGINGKNISEIGDDEVLCLKEIMKKYGIKASSIGSPIGKIKLTDNFDNHFELFKRVVRTAKMIDSKYIRIFSFYHHNKEWTKEEKKQVFAQLEKMILYAKQENVVLLHENEKDIFGDTIERCSELMKEFYCDNFKMVFDFANFVQCDQDTKEAYEKLRKYIEYIHIKDAKTEDYTIVPAGVGDGNIKYILNKLFENGYDGFLSLEPHLGTFEGLSSLELDDKMLSLPKGGEGTFTLAYNSLLEIL